MKGYSKLKQKIERATERIRKPYYQLPVAAIDHPIYRERVYCYELYHQLRCLWGGFEYSLCGEIDKRGHPDFKDTEYKGVIPDFLVHVPGNMENNLACIEVKTFDQSFTKDLKKLTWFCRRERYHRGIFLVYGYQDAQSELEKRMRVQKNVAQAAEQGAEIDLSVIEIFYHSHLGQSAQRIVFK